MIERGPLGLSETPNQFGYYGISLRKLFPQEELARNPTELYVAPITEHTVYESDKVLPEEGPTEYARDLQDFHYYLQTLLGVQSAAKNHARWQLLEAGAPEFELENTSVYKYQKKEAMTALCNLVMIDTAAPEEKPAKLEDFREYWGEDSDYYESYLRRIKSRARKFAGDEQAVTETTKASALSAGRILVDRTIPMPFKRILLEKAGYTHKQAAKILGSVAIAAGSTAIFSATAEPGAVLAAGYAVTHPFLDNLPDKKTIAVDVLSWAGFYGATYIYAKQNLRLLKKTGFGLNVFATAAYHLGNALLSEKNRDKLAVGAVFAPNFILDIAYGSVILIPEVGPSMFAAANIFGVGYTAGQALLCEIPIQIMNASRWMKSLNKK